jgi:tRNA wybutosine-synthesizing protein 1
LLAALVVATVVRLAIYSRDRREKLSVLPAPSSPVPVEEKPTVQLKPEWLPEYTTLNSSELNVDNHAEDDTRAVAAAAKVKKGPKMVKGRKTPKKLIAPPTFNHQTDRIQPLVFFQSLSGTTERYAKQFAGVLAEWTR